MKRMIVTAGAAALALWAALPVNADHRGSIVTARLLGFNEVPAVSSTGQGFFVARVQEDLITYRLTFSGLEGNVTQAHIHVGQPGVNGGISAFLCGGAPPNSDKEACPQEGTVTGTIDPADVFGPVGQGVAAGEFAELVRAIRGGVTYANVHSDKHPAGEIRGKISRP